MEPAGRIGEDLQLVDRRAGGGELLPEQRFRALGPRLARNMQRGAAVVLENEGHVGPREREGEGREELVPEVTAFAVSVTVRRTPRRNTMFRSSADSVPSRSELLVNTRAAGGSSAKTPGSTSTASPSMNESPITKVRRASRRREAMIWRPFTNTRFPSLAP